jgi:hypothetical protein
MVDGYLFLAPRYVAYGVPPLLHVLVPAGLAALVVLMPRPRQWGWVAPAIVVVGVAGYLLAVGARGPTEAGFSVVIAPARMPVYRLIESLPADVMIAGWPDLRSERAVGLRRPGERRTPANSSLGPTSCCN